MQSTKHVDPALLGIYLNDHAAGAVGGIELARRIEKSHRGTPAHAPLEHLSGEIAEDRRSLLHIMGTLSIGVQRYKGYGAWAAEKVGRLKLNGRLFRRSPISDVLELEALRLGVEGKAALWRTLRALANHETRLDLQQLNELAARARQQIETLERLRMQAAVEAFSGAESTVQRGR